MKIAYTSDIHIQSAEENQMIPDKICDTLNSQSPDVFILAGDVANTLNEIHKGMSILKNIKADKLFVPGNHDIWIEKGHDNSFRKYYKDLVNLAKDNNFIPLWVEPYIKGKFAFVGSMGWYDYSFHPQNPKLTFDDYAGKTYGGMTWMDKRKAKFYDQKILQNDQDVCEHLFQEFSNQVNSIYEDCQKIIAVFHHIPFKEMIFYRGFTKWDFFSTYMGASCFGNFLKSREKVSHVIAGHSHIPSRKKIRRKGARPIEVFSSPFGYYRTEGIRPAKKWYKKRLSFLTI